MTLLVWILRILVLFIIIRFVVLMVRNALAASAGSGASANPRARVKRQPERLGGTLVQDPQCGTYLPADRAITVERNGALEHFCSTKCRDEWQGQA